MAVAGPKFKSTGRPLDEPPAAPEYFWIRTVGTPRVEEPEGTRLHHVTAHNADEAAEMVEMIERQHADHYQDLPWRIVDVRPATEAVDPDA